MSSTADSVIADLKLIFADTDEELLKAALAQAKNNLETAVDLLLNNQVKLPSKKKEEPKVHPQELTQVPIGIGRLCVSNETRTRIGFGRTKKIQRGYRVGKKVDGGRRCEICSNIFLHFFFVLVFFLR